MKMTKQMKKILFLLLLQSSFFVFSQEYKKADIFYSITSKDILYSNNEEKKDRVIFSMQGISAKEIFNSMPNISLKNKCESDVSVKKSGNLVCSHYSDGNYQCVFGISVMTGETVAAFVC